MVNYLFLGTFSPTQISSHTHICFLFFIFFLGLFCHFKAAPTLKHCFFFKNLPTTFLATHVYIPAEVKVSLNHQPWPSYDDTILTWSSYDLNTCIFWSHRANLMHIRNTGVRWCSYHHLGIKLNCGVNSPTEVIMRRNTSVLSNQMKFKVLFSECFILPRSHFQVHGTCEKTIR